MVVRKTYAVASKVFILIVRHCRRWQAMTISRQKKNILKIDQFGDTDGESRDRCQMMERNVLNLKLFLGPYYHKKWNHF